MRSQLPLAVNLDLWPLYRTITTTWLASASKSTFGVVLLCAHNHMCSALRSWSSSSSVLCYELTTTVPDKSWPAEQPLLIFSAVRSQLNDEPWSTGSASEDVLCWTLTNLASQPLLLSSAVHSQLADEPWSAEASVCFLCFTITSIWWVLTSWSASIGGFWCKPLLVSLRSQLSSTVNLDLRPLCWTLTTT